MHSTFIIATLLLLASIVGAQCPPDFSLVPNKDHRRDHTPCVCKHDAQTVPINKGCVAMLEDDGKKCHANCPSHTPKKPHHKRQQLIMDDDGSIANCPAKMISCPIDATMGMGYECISPLEDLENCGGCVSLGQGVSCEDVPGVKKTECNHGRCINYSCRRGWILDTRSNTCIPRPRGH